MAVLVAGPSALRNLRDLRSRNRLPPAPNDRVIESRFERPTAKQRQHVRDLLSGRNDTLHFTVSHRSYRCVADGSRCTVRPSPFPRGSIFPMTPDLYFPSPELVFLQMHAHLADNECIDLGFELCGTYVRAGTHRVIHNVLPVTTRAKLQRYLQRSLGERHAKRALRNACFVCDNSGSVRETALAMFLSLPTVRGGSGLPRPQLNMPIDVGKLTGMTWRKDVRWTDIGWPGCRIAVEYDSDEFHSGTEKISRDAKRRTLLQAAGYEVIVVTNDQFRHLGELNRTVSAIYRGLGKRQRCRTRSYALKQRNLHRALLDLSREQG